MADFNACTDLDNTRKWSMVILRLFVFGAMSISISIERSKYIT